MKKAAFALVFPLLLAGAGAVLAKAPDSALFKHYMHEIFQNYRNAQMAILSGRYDVADIHLRHMLEDIDGASENIPGEKSDRGKLDRDRISTRLDELRGIAKNIRESFDKKSEREIKQLSTNVMVACADCHATARLKFLFRVAQRENLFEDYMHQISDNYSLAEVYLEEGETREAADYLTTSGYLLSLLPNVLPDEGPSGVIMDRAEFVKKIREVEGLNDLARENVLGNKGVDFEVLKKELNFTCVACHEPEKVK